MKTVSKLILITGLLAAPFVASAKSPEEVYLESYTGRTGTPVPVKVETPSVDAEFAGTSVKLAFVVDAAGQPKDVTVLDAVSPDLAKELTAAVSKWKFTPLVRDGKAVASKVILPVSIVDSFDAATRFAVK